MPEFKDPKGKTRYQIVEILKKTGGHPLSIEIIARNLREIHELENILQNMYVLGDPTQPEERFQTLEASFGYTIDNLITNYKSFYPNSLYSNHHSLSMRPLKFLL